MWKAVFKVWNEGDHLQEALKRVYGLVDQIIVIDGAYSYFPYKESERYNQPHSTDGTLDIVRDIGGIMPTWERDSEVILISNPGVPWKCETQMLNHIFRKYGKAGDYFFMIDGHELFEGDFHAEKERMVQGGWPIGKLVVCRPGDPRVDIPIEQYEGMQDRLRTKSQYRILKWHPKLMLYRRHWNYMLPKGTLDELDNTRRNYTISTKIRLIHHTRNPERERINLLHKKNLYKFRNDEINLLKWRRDNKVPDGKLGWNPDV